MADTHWSAWNPSDPCTRQLIEELKQGGYDQIWHAGDVVDKSVLEALERFCPVVCVKGNCDYFFGRDLPHTVEDNVEQVKIAMTHGWDLPLDHTPTVVNHFTEDIDLIVHGHTHQRRMQQWTRPSGPSVTIINPGSVSSPRGGGKAGFLELKIDGQRWEGREIFFS